MNYIRYPRYFLERKAVFSFLLGNLPHFAPVLFLTLSQTVRSHPPVRVPGTGIFMSENPKGIPPMLLHPLKLNRLLHETVAVSTVVVEDIPRVWSSKSAEILKRDQGIIQIILHDGFMGNPCVPKVLRSRRVELGFDPEATTFPVGSLTLTPTVSAPAMSF
jgi:KUP system potassium uptake protein